MSEASDKSITKTIIIVVLLALYVYDQIMFFYRSFNVFFNYAVVPTFIILGLILILYVPYIRKNRIKTLTIFESSTAPQEAIELLEKRIDELRQKAYSDPSFLPELAKRLIALSIYYRKKDPNKSEAYAKEALECVNSPAYPKDREAIEVKKSVEILIKK